MDLRRTALLALAFAAGCDSGNDAGADLSAALDLLAPDLAVADMAVTPFCHVAGSNQQRFYINAIKLPTMTSDFALDLNGDGKADDALGAVVSTLVSEGSTPQANLDSALAKGTEVLLLDETSGDPTFTGDTCAGSNLYKGKSQPARDPDAGAQDYQIDPSVNPGLFTGPLTAGTFDSSPPTAPPDIQMTLFLPIYGNQLAPLPVHGGHLQFTEENGFLVKGQINGAVKDTDIKGTVIPAIANALEAQVAANPTAQSSQQILVLFDLGNGNGKPCVNPDGTMGVPNDGAIAECEVADSQLIQLLLAPDVQLFQNGVYQPNPANTRPDSLSLGIAFSAVPAQF
jgi:hypothetical protein